MSSRSIFIGGPTGAGKTSIAEKVAIDLGGEIISCDSKSIYRGLDIGTAKPSQKKGIQYHMIDIIDPGEVLPVYRLVRMTREIIDDILDRGKVPIICGGSHFWMESTIKGLDPSPPPDERMRRRIEINFRNGRGEHPHDILRQMDPELAEKVHPNNIRRTLRYIERAFIKETVPGIPPFDKPHDIFFLTASVQTLKDSIRSRTKRMMENGWAEEVSDLLKRGIIPPMSGTESVGYPPVYDLLEGRIGQDECIKRINRRTLELARSQIKWARRLNNPVILDRDILSDERISEMIKGDQSQE